MKSKVEKEGWFSRLKQGLHKSSVKISQGISDVFTKQKLDDETLRHLEDILISADLGPVLAARLVVDFSTNRFGKEISQPEVRQALAEQLTKIIEPFAKPLVVDTHCKPFVILVVGVNGAGKTTTIGKLAQQYHSQGLRVMLAAGDTFRAAAVSQLKIWAERTRSFVVTGEQDSDAAALAYQALEMARAEKIDVLIMDTAGRLHNKSDLMQELAKIIRVMKKLDATSPHATLLVLDATTGQNAHAQVEVFKSITNVTGLILTKLDGSAKGGVLVSLVDKFKLPVHAIGVGEQVEDLQAFDAADFAYSLMDVQKPN